MDGAWVVRNCWASKYGGGVDADPPGDVVDVGALLVDVARPPRGERAKPRRAPRPKRCNIGKLRRRRPPESERRNGTARLIPLDSA